MFIIILLMQILQQEHLFWNNWPWALFQMLQQSLGYPCGVNSF